MTTGLATTVLDVAGEYVGAAELETLFGVGRQRVQQLVNHPTFPAPAITLKMGKVWRTDDVRAWAADRGRELFD